MFTVLISVINIYSIVLSLIHPKLFINTLSVKQILISTVEYSNLLPEKKMESDGELDPSELGSKEYWQKLYATELQNFSEFDDIGEIWYIRRN